VLPRSVKQTNGNAMVTKKINTRKRNTKLKQVVAQPMSATAPTSKNLMGLSGIAMILLTNYQTEIKKTFDIIYGFLK
jgi:hypothetical protein